MTYRHADHAGNYADIFKHQLLLLLVERLQQESAPLHLFETHAGAGRYDLFDAGERGQPAHAYLKQRYRQGSPYDAPAMYWHGISAWNDADGPLRVYPGSPLLLQHALRHQDRVTACELDTETYQQLQHSLDNDERFTLLNADGYQALSRCCERHPLPGLVFVDPPFDATSDDTAVQALLNRITTSGRLTYALWYPLKGDGRDAELLNALDPAIRRVSVNLQIMPDATRPAGKMRGCGFLVIHPPRGFASQADTVVNRLRQEWGI